VVDMLGGSARKVLRGGPAWWGWCLRGEIHSFLTLVIILIL